MVVLGGGDGRPQALGVGFEGGAPGVAGGQLGVERLERLHDLDLAVLELADVAGEVLHLLVHRLQLARRHHLPAEESLLDGGAPALRRFDLLLERRLGAPPSSSRTTRSSLVRTSSAPSCRSTSASSARSGSVARRCRSWSITVSWSCTASSRASGVGSIPGSFPPGSPGSCAVVIPCLSWGGVVTAESSRLRLHCAGARDPRPPRPETGGAGGRRRAGRRRRPRTRVGRPEARR